MVLYQQTKTSSRSGWYWVLLAATLWMVANHHSGLPKFYQCLEGMLSPIRHITEFPSALIPSVAHFVRTQALYEQENTFLREQQSRDALRLQRLLAITEENQALRGLLNAAQGYAEELHLVDVLYPNIGAPFAQKMILKAHPESSLAVGNAVLSADGVIGVVYQRNDKTAEVLLLTDPKHELPVRVQRTGLRGIAVGEGRPDSLTLRHVPLTADVRVGDVIETSGMGGRFLAGYKVAYVIEVKPKPSDSVLEIKLRPSAHLETLRQVLVSQGHQHVL